MVSEKKNKVIQFSKSSTLCQLERVGENNFNLAHSKEHCGKRKNAGYKHFFTYSRNVYKKLFHKDHNHSGLCGKGLTLYNTIPTFNTSGKESL